MRMICQPRSISGSQAKTLPLQHQTTRIMRSIVALLSIVASIEGALSLQIGIFGNSFTESSRQQRVGRPSSTSRWKRVLPFGDAAGQGFDQSTTRFSWLSAVPNDALNATRSKSSGDSLRREAEEFRRKASELMAEVKSMEAELKASRSTSKKKREEDTADLIDRMFLNRPLTPEAAAQVMKEEKWTVEEAQMVLDGLFAKAYGTTIIAKRPSEKSQEKKSSTSSTTTVVSASANESQPTNVAPGSAVVQPCNATEALLLEAKMDCLINAAEIIDEIVMASNDSLRRWSGRVGSLLQARRNELRRAHEQNLSRQLVLYEVTTPGNTSNVDFRPPAVGSTKEQGGQWLGQAAVNVNVSEVMEQWLPLWVPSSLLQFLVASPSRIVASDITTIKENVLSGTAFFCTSTESVGKAAIFRGNIRGLATTDRNMTAVVLAEIEQRLKDEGLSDRLQVFFLPDPEWKPSREQTEVQAPPKPVILAIPADVVPDHRRVQKRKGIVSKALRVTAASIPVLTTLVYAVSCYALNPKFFDAVMKQRDLVVLSACLPVFVGVFAVQAIHELAHLAVARRRGIKIGLPFPLPSFQVGTFGCITPIRSFPKDRSALLDFALSGPMSAMLISIIMMTAGINLTVRASGADILRFPAVPIALLKSSFLTGSLLTLFAPKAMIMPLSQPLPIHPLFMVGYAGLLSSALNLLPIFRLDGGRACSAAMGSRFGAVASSGTLLFLLSMALSSSTGVAFAWGALILLFQRRFEIPVRDEVTEVDDVRLGGWIGSLATAILALAPFPGGPSFL